MIEVMKSVNAKNITNRALFCLLFLLASMSISTMVYATDSRELVVITPFPYASDKEFPQNVKMEMDLEQQTPKLIVDYLNKRKAFKETFLLNDVSEKSVDLYVTGEIVTVETGNAGTRYLSGFGGGGKSLVVLDIKVYDADKKLISQGEVVQKGSSGAFSISKTFSNRANITSAIAVIGKSVNRLIVSGNDENQPEGIIVSIESFKPDALRTAAKTAANNRLYKNVGVTDAMAGALQRMLDTSEGVSNSRLIDGLAWCAINLGSLENTKYIITLENVVKSDASRKIKKHAKKSLAYLKKLSGT
jgi:hypothetical protein